MRLTIPIEGTAWELRTAAQLLRTYCDRGPVADRIALEAMADAIDAAVEQRLDA